MTTDRGTSDLVVIAAIAGAHGVRGNVRVRSFTAEPEDCFSYGPLLDKAGHTLLEARQYHPAKGHFVVTPEAPKQKEEWDSLKGTLLHVPAAALPDADEEEFYIRELVGLSVFGGGSNPIGKIKAVHDFGAGDILEIDLSDEPKPVMVPFTREDVPVVDVAAGRVVVATFDLWTVDGEKDGG